MNQSEKERLHRYRTQNLIRLLVFFAAMSVVMAMVFARWAHETLVTVRLLRHGETVNAVVVDNIPQPGDKNTVYLPRFQFRTPNEHDVTVTAEHGDNPPRYAVGTTVLVRYDPDNPDKAIIQDWVDWQNALLPLIVSGLGTAAGIGVFAFGIYRMRTIAWLQRNGMPVQAELLRVEVRDGSKGSRYFRLHCQWHDPLHGTVCVFKSECYPVPVPCFAPQTPIPVLVDPNNHKRFFVDFDSIPITNPVSPAPQSSGADEPAGVQHGR